MRHVNPIQQDLWEKAIAYSREQSFVQLKYYINPQVQVTTYVLIKDVIADGDCFELVLANGTLVQFDRVTEIRELDTNERVETKASVDEEEIFKFQLHNWSAA